MDQQTKDMSSIIRALIVGVTIVAIAVILNGQGRTTSGDAQARSDLHAQVPMIDGGHILPLKMESGMADELVKAGVIDPIVLPQATELNLLWAFGLANKNSVLEKGPIMDLAYGGPTNMASVGGWTVSRGDVMDHYSMHELMLLTSEQQALVEKVAKTVFRPCCRNSTYLPDCNHGMAMLGLLEILAGEGVNEQGLQVAAAKANSIWFPEQQQQQADCGLESPGQPAATTVKPANCAL